ncbi:MAG: ABC transporter permease, partial [Candidatus Binatia bacterium]
MRNVLTIIGKEFRSYFVSPVAYVVLTGFLLIGGWFFFNLLSRFNLMLSLYTQFQRGAGAAEQLNLNDFVISPLLQNLSIVLVILVPMITMRAYAEEKRNGTYELLLTSPVHTGELVLGKFLASFLFVCLMIGLTGIY